MSYKFVPHNGFVIYYFETGTYCIYMKFFNNERSTETIVIVSYELTYFL